MTDFDFEFSVQKLPARQVTVEETSLSAINGDTAQDAFESVDSDLTIIKGVSSQWVGGQTVVNENSANWDSSFTTVGANSAVWTNHYTDVIEASAGWNSTETTVALNSAEWVSTNTTVNTNSAGWESTESTVASNSAVWTNHYSDIIPVSSNWNSTYNQVGLLSADWQTTYQQVCSLSAAWDSGGGAAGLWVSGYDNGVTTATLSSQFEIALLPSLSASGTLYSNIISATEIHAISSFVTYQDIITELSGFSVNGNIDIDGNVSISGALVVNEINSNDWESAQTTVNSNSAGWESTESTVAIASGGWDLTQSTVITNSATWESITVANTSIVVANDITDEAGGSFQGTGQYLSLSINGSALYMPLYKLL